MQLAAGIEKYLNFLRGHASLHTVKNYTFYLKKYLEFSGDSNIRLMGLDSLSAYNNYLNTLIDPTTNNTFKNSTKNYYLIALRSLIKYLNQQKLTALRPEDITLEKQEARKVTLLDPEQIKLLLYAPDLSSKDGLRDRLILEILAQTGLKAAQVAALDVHAIDVQSLEILGLNNSTMKKIVISPEVANMYKTYLLYRKDTYKPLFIRFQGRSDVNDQGENMRLSERSIERTVEKYGKKAGFVGLTPQVLRVSYAANLLNKGEELISVAQILGHSNTDSTKIYSKAAKMLSSV